MLTSHSPNHTVLPKEKLKKKKNINQIVRDTNESQVEGSIYWLGAICLTKESFIIYYDKLQIAPLKFGIA